MVRIAEHLGVHLLPEPAYPMRLSRHIGVDTLDLGEAGSTFSSFDDVDPSPYSLDKSAQF